MLLIVSIQVTLFIDLKNCYSFFILSLDLENFFSEDDEYISDFFAELDKNKRKRDEILILFYIPRK